MNKEQFKLELKQYIREAKSQLKEFDHDHPMVHSYDKLLTKKNYINLMGLHKYIKLHTEISDDEIVKLINDNARTFKFLNYYIEVLPNGIDMLRKQSYALSAMIFESHAIEELANKQ